MDDVLQRPGELEGAIVELRGTLVAVPEGIYLVADGTPSDRWRAAALPLLEEGLLDRLFAAVPVRVGGPFYFYDTAVVSGAVTRTGDGGALRDLRGLRVERGAESYPV